MRQGHQNKRMRGRNRKVSNPLTKSYESNGPDVKIRGTAMHIAEKYAQLARDAQVSGDSVIAENYLQHAEHYHRIIAAAQPPQQQTNRDDADNATPASETSEEQNAPIERNQVENTNNTPAISADAPQPDIDAMPSFLTNGIPPAASQDGDDGAPQDGDKRRGRGPRRGPRRTPYRRNNSDQAADTDKPVAQNTSETVDAEVKPREGSSAETNHVEEISEAS